MRYSQLLAAATLGALGAQGLNLFDDESGVHVIGDKEELASTVMGSHVPYLVAAVSDDAEECPGCEKLAAEYTKAAAGLANYGVKAVRSPAEALGREESRTRVR